MGRYKIGEQLGRGGYGEVVVAEDLTFKRKVAVKILLPEHSTNEKVLKRFQGEVWAAARLNHASIPQVYDMGRDGDVFYIAMEFIEGETVQALLTRLAEQSRLPEVTLSLQMAYQVARALTLAHEKGVIHRDIKPQNLMKTPDEDAPGGYRIKILDFGIAKLAFSDSEDGQEVEGATSTGDQIPGTYTYMAPEQFGTYRGVTGQEGKMDVYALGVMMYRMLAGKLPLYSPNPAQMMGLAIAQEPDPLTEVSPHVSPSVAELVHRMLAKRPEDRPPMAKVRDRLGQLLGLAASRSELPAIRPSSQPGTPPKAHEPKPSTDEVEGALVATADAPAEAPASGPRAEEIPMAATPGAPQKSVGERSTKQQFASADFIASTGRPSGQQITGPQKQASPARRWLAIGGGAVIAVAAATAVGVRTWKQPAQAAATSSPSVAPTPPSPTPSPPAPVAEPAQAVAAPAVSPAAEASPAKASKAKTSCVAPTEACISTTGTGAQRKAILDALQETDIKLCAGQRLVIAGKPQIAIRSSGGISKGRQEQLVFAIQAALGQKSFVGEVSVQCKGK